MHIQLPGRLIYLLTWIARGRLDRGDIAGALRLVRRAIRLSAPWDFYYPYVLEVQALIDNGDLNGALEKKVTLDQHVKADGRLSRDTRAYMSYYSYCLSRRSLLSLICPIYG